jgi:hypothetical protein
MPMKKKDPLMKDVTFALWQARGVGTVDFQGPEPGAIYGNRPGLRRRHASEPQARQDGVSAVRPSFGRR